MAPVEEPVQVTASVDMKTSIWQVIKKYPAANVASPIDRQLAGGVTVFHVTRSVDTYRVTGPLEIAAARKTPFPYPRYAGFVRVLPIFEPFAVNDFVAKL